MLTHKLQYALEAMSILGLDFFRSLLPDLRSSPRRGEFLRMEFVGSYSEQ